jgi:hypothetical protein
VVASNDVPPSSSTLHFALGGRVLGKLGASVVIGGAAAALGVPLVPISALLMGGVLLARTPRVVVRRITLQRAQANAHLGPLDQAVLDEVRAARAAIASPALLGLLRSSLGYAAEVAGSVRSSGAHLTVEGYRQADAHVAQVTRTISKLAVKLQTLARASTPDAAPYRGQVRAYDAVLGQLQALADRLAALRAPAAQIRVPDQARSALAAVLAGLKPLSDDCANAMGAVA